MKKKVIMISIIAEIFILCLCVKPADGSRDELAELINAGETQPEQEAESEPWWCKIKSPGTVSVKKRR